MWDVIFDGDHSKRLKDHDLRSPRMSAPLIANLSAFQLVGGFISLKANLTAVPELQRAKDESKWTFWTSRKWLSAVPEQENLTKYLVVSMMTYLPRTKQTEHAHVGPTMVI